MIGWWEKYAESEVKEMGGNRSVQLFTDPNSKALYRCCTYTPLLEETFIFMVSMERLSQCASTHYTSNLLDWKDSLDKNNAIMQLC